MYALSNIDIEPPTDLEGAALIVAVYCIILLLFVEEIELCIFKINFVL